MWWKLHRTQLHIYKQIMLKRGVTQTPFVLNCSRRLGKSFLLALISAETCIQNPGAIVRYAAPTAKSLRTYILPIFKQLFADCPHGLRPKYNSQDNVFRFPNGSEIYLAGTDNGHEESLRGPRADMYIVDEAGSVNCSLRYLVQDILLPQLLYSKISQGIIASTPPPSPAHEFVWYVSQAEIHNVHAHATIWDNPWLSRREILLIAESVGCEIDWNRQEIVKTTTTWLREFMAEIVTDTARALVPEYNKEAEQDIFRAWPIPDYRYRYTIIDTGFIDLTFCLFLYHDFANAKIVFEDELVCEKPTSEIIANGCSAIEQRLWGNARPHARYGDGDLIVLQDLSSLHNFYITPVSKDNLEAQVNQARIDVQRRNVVIMPACKNLNAHLKYGIWDKQRRKFERCEGFGHFDGVAAFIYALRHVNRTLNPYPPMLGISEMTHFVKGAPSSESALEKIFGG